MVAGTEPAQRMQARRFGFGERADIGRQVADRKLREGPDDIGLQPRPLRCRGMSQQLRGGGELGEAWYRGGKLEHKQNTFGDFIACAEQLLADGYTTSPRLAISGGSAGGLSRH